MIANDHETLDATTWFERMRRFVEGLGHDNGFPDRHIRKAYHLHCLAPQPLKSMMAPPMEEERLEAMLECGAYESAVNGLFGKPGSVTVRDGENAGIEVRMRVDPVSLDAETDVDAWPMAMLEAWGVSYLRLRPLPN